MTELHMIRLDNARQISEASGGQVNVVEILGKTQTQVSQLIGKNPKKTIGNRIARDFEQAFNLPHLWMDSPQDYQSFLAHKEFEKDRASQITPEKRIEHLFHEQTKYQRMAQHFHRKMLLNKDLITAETLNFMCDRFDERDIQYSINDDRRCFDLTVHTRDKDIPINIKVNNYSLSTAQVSNLPDIIYFVVFFLFNKRMNFYFLDRKTIIENNSTRPLKIFDEKVLLKNKDITNELNIIQN